MIDNKFRAWDTENNCYFEEPYFKLLIANNGKIYNSENDEWHEPNERYIIQWFSGYKDKNKTDIYEGDIIELINEANEKIRVVCEFGKVTREIMGFKLNECYITGFYFRIPNGKATFPIVNNYLGISDLELFEVIGNIRENANLIN